MSAYQGSVAWVTGAGSGIGRALAIELAKQGAKVALSGRRADRLEAVASEIAALGGEALPCPCDVTAEAELIAARDAVLARFGKLDLVIANAGYSVSGPVETVSAAQWERQLAVNVVGVANTARVSLPALKQSRGRIALVGSAVAWVGIPKNGAYCASKAAVRAIGDALSAELAGSGVSCTQLHPGFVESEIAQVDNDGQFDPSRKDKRPQQLMWKADDAARAMLRAVAARRRLAIITGHAKVLVLLARLFPGLVAWLLTRR